MALKLVPNNILLHCNICIKKPDFSDVSHLLTHIASKSHLSTYYKIKVKAGTEEMSRRIIEEYDTWYARWAIEDLMSDRLKLKDRRKSKSRTGTSTTSSSSFVKRREMSQQAYNDPSLAALADQHHFQPTYAPPMGSVLYDPSVDPRLVPRPIKTETTSRDTTPLNGIYLDPSMMHAPYPPYSNPLSYWPPFSYAPVLPKEAFEDGNSSEASFPPSIKAPSRSHADNTSVVEGEFEELHDSNKLKGLVWPGMDMFDAALPEQKRKRNQKKDTSVVKQLEIMSRLIEATEHIYSPQGTHCAARAISGLPDIDDIPLPGEETPPRPKKAKRVTVRKPLAEKDPNAGRKPVAKVQKRGSTVRGTASTKMTRRKPIDSEKAKGSRAPATQQRNRKNEPPGLDVSETTFDNPAEMNLLTAPFQLPGQYQGADPRTVPNGFRPAETSYVNHLHQGYYAYQHPGYYANPFAFEPSVLPGWEFYTNDTNAVTANPLFLGADHNGTEIDDDDEGTISVPDSEQ
ncbi:hypothetical protein BDV97DRAFT_106156 [Delphinella strobiligena]|nr:hypothetical protein BDV97DRAFT_106156 [Delphinella strobiligena]